MGGEPKFGTQSCPIELENEDDEEDFRAVGHKKKKALLQPSPLTSPNSTDNTTMKTLPSGLEIVPFNNPSPSHEPSTLANPKVTAPVSPSIEDLANPRVAESGNHSPGDPGHPEYLWALDDATHGGTLPGASHGFKRLTKGHRSSAGHVKSEHMNGADVGSSQKTELEREMELYEAAEREEEARLLTSLRHNQSGDCSPSSKSPNSMESIQADWKRGPGGSLGEQPRPKRGRKAGTGYQALRKEEDVCFACFDGGDLILCDKRSCPKAYHMDCTGRESEFFRMKGQWFCGWHVCAHCTRSATMHCYTCPNAYCNGCTKKADFLCLRKGRGLCGQCYRIVYMIEHNLSIDSEGEEVNFDDEETYECLYRDYWKDIKEKLSLSWSEINKAYKAKDEGEPPGKGFSTERLTDDEGSSDSDCRPVKRQSQRLKRKRVARNALIDDASASDFEEEEQEEEEEEEEENLGKPKRGQRKRREFIGWASKELVEFLNSLKEDSKKPLTLLSLNKLVLSYVEANKLGNPRRRGQIRCDERLQILFGKKHVGKFQMMKLLNKHIASRGTNVKSSDVTSGCEDNDNGNDKVHKQRKTRKKLDESRHLKLDPSKYAAIDVNNISLIYLKRSLLEDLQKDSNFENKVKGAFVRIRVPSLVNKNDTCYRLVQIVGIKQALNSRNNMRTANVMLEISNLQKQEEITVDLISGQDFTEEECQRLRQSVKCGLLKAMTVGELREKARILREAKVKDWFNTELLRLSHLRDRASEKGLKKDLRECVERLQVLSSPSERERQLRAPIEVNVDPHMDPDYESDNAGNSMKDSQGTQNPWDTRFVEKQWERKTTSVKRSNYQDNGEVASHSRTWETKSKLAGWGDQKDSGRDNLHILSGKPVQDWISASNEKSTRAGIFRMGLADGAGDHHAGGLNCQERIDPADHNDTGLNCQGSLIQKKEDHVEGIANDDGWGEDLKGNHHLGWGDGVGGHKKSDGWREKGDSFKNDDGWEGGNAKGDKWAVTAVDTTKTDGWGVGVGSNKKDGGWNCKAEGLGEDASNQKEEICDTNLGGGMKDCSWGNNVGTNEKDGWEDIGGDDHKHDGLGHSNVGTNEKDGWGDGGGDGHKHDGWGHSAGVNSHNDGWGHCGGSSGNDDGWGDTAGGESEGGWGNHAGKNEKPVTWGAEASGNETKTGGGWGKTNGNSSDPGWGANASGAERNRSWNNRGSFRDTGFDRRGGMPRADTGPCYRNTGGFGRVSGETSAHTRTAVPAVTRTEINGVGVAIENEREKVWYYQDPSKTTQGPFSMEQLRKWEKTKLFPLNLRVWRAGESQDASILLTDALLGKFCNDLPPGFDQFPARGFSASRGDLRNAHVPGRPGSDWQDKGGRPKYNEWVSERHPANHNDGGSGMRPERPWGSQGPDKLPSRDGGWDGSRCHWNRGLSDRNPSDYHYSNKPANDGRFSTKKKDFPCRYFARGMCKKGDECDFMH